MERIRLGISSCLLGERVRYDGGHKLDPFLTRTVGRYVEWVPVCPEAGSGLPVPRDAMRLMGGPSRPRLVTIDSGIDHTDRLLGWAKKKLARLEPLDLCGFVLKSRSPSCGLRAVKIFTKRGRPSGSGPGLFAGALMDRFPLLPVEDEERFRDPVLRENFIERLFVYKRWTQYRRRDGSVGGLFSFHEEHELLVIAHSRDHHATLGKLVSAAGKMKQGELLARYGATLLEGLRYIATTRKNTNVLRRLAGYFRRQISPEERWELGGAIEDYCQGLVPLVVPVTLIRHYAREYGSEYLVRQRFLNPDPLELTLRNHA